jgi:hypothetical protein
MTIFISQSSDALILVSQSLIIISQILRYLISLMSLVFFGTFEKLVLFLDNDIELTYSISERRTPPALNTFKATQLNDIWHYFIEIDTVD